MTETLTLRSERVDDIPLLLAQLDRMGVQRLRDEHFRAHLRVGGGLELYLKQGLEGAVDPGQPEV